MLVAVLVVGGAIALVPTTTHAQQAIITVSDIQYAATVRLGSSGQAALIWQRFLNGYSTTAQLVEDGKFGPLSTAQAKAWQSSRGLVADGVLGTMSRAAAMAQIASNTPASAFPVGCTSNINYSSTTGLPCAGVSYPAGCTATSAFSSTTGLPCTGTVVTTLPAGCTATSAYSSTTGLPCTGTVVVGTGEGSITLDYDTIPAASVVISKGVADQSAVAFKVKATGSSMNVSRVWLNFDARLWLYADTASLWDGSTMLASTALSASAFSEVTAGSLWQLQFNNLNVNVAAGTTKVLTLKLSRPMLTQLSGAVTLQTSSSVRATDAAGFSNTYSPTATRAINLTATNALSGTLTTSLNVNSPAAQSVAALSATAGVLTPVKLMDFDLKAQDSAINVTSIDLSSLTTTAVTLTNQVASVELRDGTNVLSSVTGAADPAAFASLNIDIPAGTTKTLSIWVQMNPVAAADAAGFTLKGVGITAVLDSSVVATDAAWNTITVSSADITSKTQYMYQYAPALVLGAISATQVEGSAAGKKAGNYSLAFTVTAPSGSDLYVDGVSTLAAVVRTDAAVGTALSKSITVSGVVSQGAGATATFDKVAAGTSRTFTVTGYVSDGTGAGFTGIKLVNVTWVDNIAGTGPVTQTWGLSDFKTGNVFISL